MYENEEDIFFGAYDNSSHYLLPIFIVPFIHVGVLTANIENKVIVLKPFLTKYLRDQLKTCEFE